MTMEIDAKTNYWNSSHGPEEAAFKQDGDDGDQAGVIGNVTYQPFLRNSPGKNRQDSGSGNGNGSGGVKGNGNEN